MTAPEPDESRRIVVGVDGAPASLSAISWAAAQASLSGAVVEVVTAWQAPPANGVSPVAPGPDRQTDAETVQAIAVREAVGDQVSALIRHVVQGHPVRVLLDAAIGAELVVVGDRGHGGYTGMLLGSISERVVAHAPCPVVVIRATPTGGARGRSGHDRVDSRMS
jgi:nucleotide-binding universal stress UspA family protein